MNVGIEEVEGSWGALIIELKGKFYFKNKNM